MSEHRAGSPSSSQAHTRQPVHLGPRRPPSLQEDFDSGTDLGATIGKRRASVPDASFFASAGALSPSTFGVDLHHTTTDHHQGNSRQQPDSAYSSQRNTLGSIFFGADSSHLSVNSPVPERRHSAAVSFFDDFPTPPTLEHETMPSLDIPPGPHASAFGQVVTGPPGAGKTTYCNGMHQVSSVVLDNIQA